MFKVLATTNELLFEKLIFVFLKNTHKYNTKNTQIYWLSNFQPLNIEKICFFLKKIIAWIDSTSNGSTHPPTTF
jgi:hypothetical protein